MNPLFVRSILLLCLLPLSFCRFANEEIDKNPDQDLVFYPENRLRTAYIPNDTLRFDTVFNTFRSATRRIRVYNPNAGAVLLKNVRLGQGLISDYSIIINGRKGPKNVENIAIEGKDSIMVLVETTPSPNSANLPLLVEDFLIFELEGRPARRVVLQAYGQQAILLNNPFIVQNTIFTAARPYIILPSGYFAFSSLPQDTIAGQGLFVLPGVELSLQAGARLYFSASTGLFVQGKLNILGTKQKPVQLGGLRLEPAYQNQSNQWLAIVLGEQSQNNRIDYGLIKNGFAGVQIGFPNRTGQPDLTISNTKILNMASAGILAFNPTLIAYNNIITDCAQYLLAGFRGGIYQIYHNTLGYSGNQSFIRKTPAVLLADFYIDAASRSYPGQMQNVPEIINNIIWGSQPNELEFLSQASALAFAPKVLGNLIRFDGSKPINYDTTNRKNKLVRMGFEFRNASKYDLRPDSLNPLSRAAGVALTNMPAPLLPALQTDIEQNPRDATKPDRGAYQWP